MAVTIDDIAKEAGVSSATISRVINNSENVKDETRRRILKIIEERNYVPSAIARSLSKNESSTIGIIVPDVTNPYFGEIIKGVSKTAVDNDLNIVLFDTDNDIKKELKALSIAKEQRLKGIIMTPGFAEKEWTSDFIKAFKGLNIPIVLVSSDLKYIKLNGVFVDDIKGGMDATNLLIREGHKKIGIITGFLSSGATIDRVEGYKKALIENGIEIREDYILNGEYNLEKTYEITKNILEMQDPPTALITCSNRMTLGVMKALVEKKKIIPNDIALIGFNRLEVLDIVGLDLTYVEDYPIELGKQAVEMLIDVLNSNNTKKSIRVKVAPELIIKGSEKRV